MAIKIRHFIHHQAASGMVLIFAALMAFLWANSPFAALYESLISWPLKLGWTMGDAFYGLQKPLLLWVNDALMTLFFLLVGLEIKREILTGELSTKTKALQPVFAALGGIIVPALVYLAITYPYPDLHRGWAVSSATDIAFALGILAMLGSRIPVFVKVMLTAIAIIDDLAAIVIIALFYTETISLMPLACAGIGCLGLFCLNRWNVKKLTPYLLIGLLIWIGFYEAGLHPTLAGVLTALAVPLRQKQSGAPLLRLETRLHPWVAFGVLPIFAFMNAGLPLGGLTLRDMGNSLTLGVLGGLLVGKPVGIMIGLIIGHLSGWARKPVTYPWTVYLGMAFLCGIGFTMALFIGELAFDQSDMMRDVKLGVLSASLLSAAIGWTVCRFTFPKTS